MQWLTFLGPTLAVIVAAYLNARALRRTTEKLGEVHEIVNGQHTALEQLVSDRDATITQLKTEAETP